MEEFGKMNWKYVFNRFTSVCTVGLFREQVNDLPPPALNRIPASLKLISYWLVIYDGKDNLCIGSIFSNNP